MAADIRLTDLRDLIAAFALAGILANPENKRWPLEVTVEHAYQLADIALRMREKGKAS